MPLTSDTWFWNCLRGQLDFCEGGVFWFPVGMGRRRGGGGLAGSGIGGVGRRRCLLAVHSMLSASVLAFRAWSPAIGPAINAPTSVHDGSPPRLSIRAAIVCAVRCGTVYPML